MTIPLARLKKYGLAAPCADDVRSSVAAVDYRNFTATWNAACERAGVSSKANLMSLEELHSLADALSSVDGPVSLLGRALEIRVSSYEELSTHEEGEFRASDPSRRIFEDLIRTRVPDGDVIRELYSLDVFSEENELKLHDAARRAASALRAEVGVVNVLLGGSQSIIGSYGPIGWAVKTGGTPIEWAFCATTVRREEPYLVPDAKQDVMQRTNPNVSLGQTRCYAGVPVTSNGLVIGSLCVTGSEARHFDDEAVGVLQEIADGLATDLGTTRDRRVAESIH